MKIIRLFDCKVRKGLDKLPELLTQEEIDELLYAVKNSKRKITNINTNYTKKNITYLKTLCYSLHIWHQSTLRNKLFVINQKVFGTWDGLYEKLKNCIEKFDDPDYIYPHYPSGQQEHESFYMFNIVGGVYLQILFFLPCTRHYIELRMWMEHFNKYVVPMLAKIVKEDNSGLENSIYPYLVQSTYEDDNYYSTQIINDFNFKASIGFFI